MKYQHLNPGQLGPQIISKSKFPTDKVSTFERGLQEIV